MDPVTLQNEEDIYEYLYDISSQPSMDSLGIISRASDSLSIGDVTIEQSRSLLYQHSTGAVVWSVTPIFNDWIRRSPLNIHVSQKTIVELGSGTGALALLLHNHVKRFVVTDQRPLLKLSKRNCSGIDNVEIQEFDWETDEFEGVGDEGVIVACDTIYNEFLIKPFTEAIESVWSTSPKVKLAIIAMQLRDTVVTEKALSIFVAKFKKVDCYEMAAGFVAFVIERLS